MHGTIIRRRLLADAVPPPVNTKDKLAALAEQIKADHAAALAGVRHALARSISAGERLIEAHKLVRHGKWLPWLKTNVGIPARTASRYMQCYRDKDAVIAKAKSASLADLIGQMVTDGDNEIEWIARLKAKRWQKLDRRINKGKPTAKDTIKTLYQVLEEQAARLELLEAHDPYKDDEKGRYGTAYERATAAVVRVMRALPLAYRIEEVNALLAKAGVTTEHIMAAEAERSALRAKMLAMKKNYGGA